VFWSFRAMTGGHEQPLQRVKVVAPS